jgi:hypothetical protein
MRGGRRRGLRITVGVAAAMLITLLTTLTAIADCGDTSAAVLQGAWHESAVTTFQGGPIPPSFVSQQAHQADGTMFFTSTCAAPGSCTVVVSNTSDVSESLVDNNTGLYTNGTASPLVQSGSDFTATFAPGGFGGRDLPPCSPPRSNIVFTVHVGAATRDASGSGWQAVYITGSEVSLANWTCNSGVGVASLFRHVDFVGAPVGHPIPATVAAACPAASRTPATASQAATTGASTAQQPSTISTALAEPSSVFGSLGHAIGNALITLGIVLFITFPATLFNKTFEENYDDIRDIVKRRFGWLARLSSRVRAGANRARDLAAFVLVVLVGSALGGLNDPHFGFNRSSVLTYSAVILAVLFGVGSGTLVGFAYRRARHLAVAARLHALPAGLVVAGACVLVSRLTQFEPGYLYGIICGVAFAATLERDQNGHLTALSSAVTLALGVIAWLLWVPVHRAAAMPGASPFTVIVGNFLAAVFVGGLVGSVISLVPLRFLPGGALVEWNRLMWGTLFALAVFGLLQVMLRPESSSVHTGTTAVVTAGILFVLFGAASVATRIYFGRRRRRVQLISPA